MTPYLRQETDFFCGPAVAQMVLASAGFSIAQEDLAAELKTSPAVGTTAARLVTVLNAHGVTAVRNNNAVLEDIGAALAAGQLVIVGYIATEPHYALVSSVGDGNIVLRDPFFGEGHTMPLEEFETKWHDHEPHVYGDRLLITIQKHGVPAPISIGSADEQATLQ